MNIILGFGLTEEQFETGEQEWVQSLVNEYIAKDTDSSWHNFSDEFITELESKIKERSAEYKRLDKEYHDAENYPTRYSSYYATVLHDLHNIAVIMKFTHINRRHALSPDGWGAMYGTKVFLYEAN